MGYARLFNLMLRGMTLVSKFLLIFFLARFLEPAELGLYGLIVVTISYALYLLGLDFYIFSTREVIKRNRSEWGGLLKDQGAITLILYAVFMPPLLLIFSAEILPWAIVGWFFALLILEHVNQELMRLLVAISKPLLASLVLFLRSGSWALVVTTLMFIRPEMRSLDNVLTAWTLGGLSASFLAVVSLYRLNIGGWRKQVDWSWIWKGVRVALPFLVATLAIRGLFTIDRYWLEALSGIEVLGAYVLFIGIGNAMMSFLDAGVFAFIYPGMIAAFQQDSCEGYRKGLRKLLFQTLILSIGFVVAALVMIDPLLSWVDKPVFHEQLGMFPLVLLASLLYALGMVPHYALYAQGKDRPIIFSHVASLVVFVIATWLFSMYWSQLAVPLGLCVAFFMILLWKSIAFLRLTPTHYRSLQS